MALMEGKLEKMKFWEEHQKKFFTGISAFYCWFRLIFGIFSDTVYTT